MLKDKTAYQRRREAEEALRNREFGAVELGEKIGATERTARRIINELSAFLPVIETSPHRYRIC